MLLKKGSPNKKIAFVLPALYGGGAERVALRIANGLAEKGYNVDLVLSQFKGSYISLVSPKVNVVDLGCSDKFVTLKSIPKLISYLKKNKPKVLFSTLFRTNFIVYLTLLLSASKSRLVIRHPNMLYPKGSKDSFYTFVTKKLAIKTAQKADAVVLTSQLMKDELLSLASFDIDKLHIIPNPVPVKEIQEKADLPLQHEWFEEDSDPVILSVGRLTQQKGYVDLINAFAKVVVNTPSKLLILGEGEQRYELEELIKQLKLENKVALPGFVDNPYQYMARAKVFALPSKWEGFPNVLVEAMACGTKVVAADCPGGTAEILENGKWGALTTVNDVPALVNALIEALQDNKPSLSKSRVNDFTLEEMLKKYEQVLY